MKPSDLGHRLKFSDLDHRSIVLWGLGRETSALRRQLERRLPTARITTVIDDSTPQAQASAAIRAADVLVRSPGVSIYKPLIREALANGVPVTTATSLWLAQRGPRRVIGVTGTKGKSTTAAALAQLMRSLVPVELAGNIGRPVIDSLELADDRDTWVVLELSSYHISDLASGPEIALITNLYREHTDWHGSERQYRADKLRLLSLPGVRAVVYPSGDPQIRGAAARSAAAPTAFGDPDGWHVDGAGTIKRGTETVLTAAQIPLRGRHNAVNVSAALAAIEAAGLERPMLPAAIRGLQGLPHRLQTVHVDAHQVEWVDDSISTTPESTIAALETFAGRELVLIAGGQDRRQDYDELGRWLAANAARTILITLPDTGPALARAAHSHGHPEARMATAGDMREATRTARMRARPEAVVLLSPAAPSYNAYLNFEARGDEFAACARTE